MKTTITILLAASFGAFSFIDEAKAESCPWDMVWDRAKGDCVYYQPGGSGSTSTNNNGAQAGAIAGSNATGGNGYGGEGGNAMQGQQQAANANNRVTIDNRTRQSAAQAAPALIQNTGNTLCDGGGSFSASVQTFGWGISAANKKGDRFCQLLVTFGPQVAGAYIAEKDNAAKRAMLNNGVAITSRQAASPEGRVTVRCPDTHPVFVEGRGCRK